MFHEVELFLATAEAAGAIVPLVTDRRVSQDELGRARVFRVTEAAGGGTYVITINKKCNTCLALPAHVFELECHSAVLLLSALLAVKW